VLDDVAHPLEQQRVDPLAHGQLSGDSAHGGQATGESRAV
jgi:hypothetical protein